MLEKPAPFQHHLSARDRHVTKKEGPLHALGASYGLDIWDEADSHIPQPAPDAPLDQQLRYWGDYGSIYSIRAQKQAGLRDFERFNDYGGEQDTGAMDHVLTLLNAEIQLGRAAFPDRPLYIVKVDLRALPEFPTLIPTHLESRVFRFCLALTPSCVQANLVW